MIFIITSFLLVGCISKCAYEKEGIEQGEKQGIEIGRKEGYEKGHKKGVLEGYNQGYEDAIAKRDRKAPGIKRYIDFYLFNSSC